MLKFLRATSFRYPSSSFVNINNDILKTNKYRLLYCVDNKFNLIKKNSFGNANLKNNMLDRKYKLRDNSFVEESQYMNNNVIDNYQTKEVIVKNYNSKQNIEQLSRENKEEKKENKKTRPKVGKIIKYFSLGAILGIITGSFVKSQIDETSRFATNIYCWIPTRIMSTLFGKVFSLELPSFILYPGINFYCWLYDCKLDEMKAESIREFKSLQEFFQRELKSEVRPIDKDERGMVSPVDGTVLYCSEICPIGTVEQVKGVRYSVSELIGEKLPLLTNTDRKYMHCIIYLAPGDYHGFHSPVDCNFKKRIHVTGELFSVAPIIAKLIPSLFSINERVVLSGSWNNGAFYYVPVGATNVGSIGLEFEKDLYTNRFNQKLKQVFVKDYTSSPNNSDGINLKKGEKIGTFKLGSTIILVFEAPKNHKFLIKEGDKVKLGSLILGAEEK